VGSTRVRLNFYVLLEKAMRVLDGDTNWFRAVCLLRGASLVEPWIIEIERRGVQYHMIAIGRASAALQREIANCELHDLAKTCA
jgi:hypothetical protein